LTAEQVGKLQTGVGACPCASIEGAVAVNLAFVAAIRRLRRPNLARSIAS
jgi:hypothetical protein